MTVRLTYLACQPIYRETPKQHLEAFVGYLQLRKRVMIRNSYGHTVLMQ